jgi:hypothetical protein
MTNPDIVQCPDQHFRRVLYGLGPHISDYPEQVAVSWILTNWCATYVCFFLYPLPKLTEPRRCHAPPHALDDPSRMRSADHTAVLLSMHTGDTLREKYGIAPNAKVSCICIRYDINADCRQPYTSHFPRADIHELVTPDLLHQAIKGVYKDHLVTWVSDYLEHYHGAAGMERILDEIDRRFVYLFFHHNKYLQRYRIALAPPFPGLRRFKQGRNFNQWTGDDSKALMKVNRFSLQHQLPDPLPTGVYECYRRIRLPRRYPNLLCIPGVLLHCPSQ